MLKFRKLGLALLLAALLVLTCGVCSAEEELPASLSEIYGGMAPCKTCGEFALVEANEYNHAYTCQNEACTYYGVERNWAHVGSCVDSSVCGVCGGDYDGYYAHVYDGAEYSYNEDRHWRPCVLCGDEEDSGWYSHTITCQDNDACTTCGMPAQDFWTVRHNGDGVYLSDEMEHWQTCLDCGQACNRSTHYGPCDTKICNSCDSAITVNDQFGHSRNYDEMVINPDKPEYHGYACTREGCGNVSSNGYHYAECNAPDVCAGCGIEYTGTRIEHEIDWEQMIVIPSKPSNHGYACSREGCDYVDDYGSHYADCGEPGVCGGCGIEYTGTRVEHELNWDEMIVNPDDPTVHGYACMREGCGYVSTEGAHYAECNAPGVCGSCGIEYTGSKVEHSYNYSKQVLNPDNPARHGYACKREGCGYVSEGSSHSAACDAPGVCASCGVEYTGTNRNHSYDYNVGMVTLPGNPSNHGYICTVEGCGYANNYGSHYTNCDESGVCSGCGAKGEGFRVSHSTNWEDPAVVNPDNANEHGRYCERGCGTFTNNDVHYAECSEPGLCVECGVTFTGGYTSHDVNWEAPMIVNPSNPSSHGRWCNAEGCGYFSDEGSHYATCDAPGVCVECGVEDDSIRVNHVSNRDLMVASPTDADKHGWYCTLKNCGYFVVDGNHSARCDALGVCYQCGAEYTGSRVQHSINYDVCIPHPDYPNNHGYACTVEGCGYVSRNGEHFAACDAPGFCEECGVVYTGSEVSHDYYSSGYSSNEGSHWRNCVRCGMMSSPEAHTAECGKPGVCVECSAVNESITEVQHYFYDELYSDENSHWYSCYNCSKKIGVEGHAAACNAPGVCRACGAEYTGASVSHSYDYESYSSDENGHGYVCRDCKTVGNRNAHYSSCDEPGVCAGCGWEGENMRSEHNWSKMTMESDAVYHWRKCSCGEIFERETHYEFCYNPGVCGECGLEGEGFRVGHCDSGRYVADENGHQRICAYCGGDGRYSEHWISCSNPGVCEECGAENISGHVGHDWSDGDPYYSDAASHWRLCRSCGEKVNYDAHRDNCINPGVCEECGAACSHSAYPHNFSSFASDENFHWYVCTLCGEADPYKMAHARACGSDSDFCAECGAAYSGTAVKHAWDYDTGAYYVQGGYHWRICEVCEVKFEREAHFAICSNPGVCEQCGTKTDYLETYHDFYDRTAWQDEDGHWNKCDRCGVEEFLGDHYADCADPDVCVECGMSMESARFTLMHFIEYTSTTAATHSYACACGASGGTERHFVYCVDATATCIECGESGVSGLKEHGESIGMAEMDEYSHWYPCNSCGEVAQASAHVFECQNPGVCVECGMETEHGNAEHFAGSAWISDETGHWKVCAHCGEKTSFTTHGDRNPVDGVCDTCGYEVSAIGPYSNYDSIEILFSGVSECSFENLYVYNPDGAAPGKVSVTSSDTSVVTVRCVAEYDTAARWRIEAEKTGSAALTLTSPNGKTKTVSVTVRAAAGAMELPDGTKKVEAEAFKGIAAEVIGVPDGATAIGEGAFAGNTRLKAVYIPDSVESLGEGIFRGCPNVRVYASADCAAYQYAIDNGISVVIIY